jgi:predicted ester cyclase
MHSEEKKAVVRRLAQAVNSGDLDDLDNVLAPNYIRHDPNPLMKDVGREEYKQAFKKLRNAFPDAKWTLDDILSDGDKVIGRWSFLGTQNGPFFNIPPSGKEVTYPILAIYRIEDEMIAEDWHIFHSLGLWQTLIPEIGSLIEEATK